MDIRELVLSQCRRRYDSATVTIDGKAVTVWFRSLSGTERDAYESSLLVERTKLVNGRAKKGKELSLIGARAKLVAATACKGENNLDLLFTEQDVSQLGEVDGGLLDALYTVAARVARITEDDVKEVVGNSESAPNAVSG